MAEVFRAIVPGAEGFRRDLVVKRILEGQSTAANFIEMFVHEARISALLHHPNIVQVFDFGQVDGSYFLAMELLRGRDLLRVMRSLRERGRMLPIPIAAHIAHQVALGLGYAHDLRSPDGQALNIVHRDVSPSNIMCLRAGGVKLLDFGIASAIGEVDAHESERGGFKGKLAYMAPESVRGEPQDGRIDLFALGTVLWEMLAGRRLFYGKTDADKLKAILERAVPAPRSLRPNVPAELERIVMKALARDPRERYQTGRQMAEDLEQVVLAAKYQSRMLPALLEDLYGTAPSAAHVAMSSLPPELLSPVPPPASVADTERSQLSFLDATPANGNGTDSMIPAASADGLALASTAAAGTWNRAAAWARGWGRTKALLLVAAVGGLTVAGLIILGANRAGSRKISAPAPATAAAPAPAAGNVGPGPAAPPSAPHGEPASAAREVSDTETAPTGGQRPTEPPSASTLGSASGGQKRAAAAAVRHPVIKTATGIKSGRVTRGLSIDPFAEAASRKRK